MQRMAKHGEGHVKRSPIAPDELGARLRARRRELGLNLREAAAASGVSTATLSRVERGRLPDRDNIFKLIDWLGLGGGEAYAEPHPPGAGTLEAIELHLRADKELSRDDADALSQMVRLAYERLRRGGA
jgi:transcriptional regulator with XRE-family HTH domain